MWPRYTSAGRTVARHECGGRRWRRSVASSAAAVYARRSAYDKIQPVTHANSDDWLSRGFRSGKRRCVVRSLVYYRVWTDHDDQPVGVTVDYEYAEDVHFDLDFASWLVFLEAAEIDWTVDANPKRLKDALYRDGYSVFESALVQLELPYRRLVYR